MCVTALVQWHRARPRLAIFSHLAITVFLLGFALVSQYFFGLNPCILCLWQRVPYVAIGLLALISLGLNSKYTPWFLAAFAALYFAEAGIAFFHIGVQAQWWEGTRGCGFQATANDVKALYEQIKDAPLARCNEVTWRFLGFSMAAWNCAIAIALAALSILQAQVQRVWWTNKPPQ